MSANIPNRVALYEGCLISYAIALILVNALTNVFYIVDFRRRATTTHSMPRFPVVGVCDNLIIVDTFGYGPPATSQLVASVNHSI